MGTENTVPVDQAFLEELREHQYVLPNSIDPFQLVLKLLGNLRSPDPILRDKLSYTTLAHLLGTPLNLFYRYGVLT
ncbi:MAG: hypothetical protein A2201_04685 [Alicyclobacillus sp. RIFOXYA1_FULL_53_8]|nr:MAG: hypothetical protein A2201_04685 [Alicyclobacillus sp. RIFOXYA1_FULL_53_8]